MLFASELAPVAETSLASYFKQRLSYSAQQLRPPPHDDTCWYLGSLLDRFGRSEDLFSYKQGEITLRPLALLYSDALEARNARDRCLLLRQLGDMALFLGALFPERFASRGIHKDYFIGMGGSAYDYLADNAHQNRHIFLELSRTFARMLELVAHACSRQHAASASEVLNVYQRWRDTRDPLSAKKLETWGIDLSASDSIQ